MFPSQSSDMIRKRRWNLGIFLVLLGIEILIALFVHDSFFRPYVGDVLAVAVVYFPNLWSKTTAFRR